MTHTIIIYFKSGRELILKNITNEKLDESRENFASMIKNKNTSMLTFLDNIYIINGIEIEYIEII